MNSGADRVLLIHGGGAEAFTTDAALAASLRDGLGAGYALHYLQMPDENQPAYVVWRDRIAQELATMEGVVYLVGHSLGGSVLLKYLAEAGMDRVLVPMPASITIAGLFLLASPFWGTPDWEVDEYTLPEGFAARLPPDLPVLLYHCRDDAVVPFAHLALYAQHLPHATLRAIDQGGHQLGNDLAAVARDISALAANRAHAARLAREQ